MGKKKLTVIDDSQPVVEEIKEERKKVNPNREILVEKTRTDTSSATGGSEEMSLGTTAANEVSEEVPKETELTGPVSKKKIKKPGKQKNFRGKKYQEKVTDLDKTKTYPLNEAVELAKKLSYSKFTGTLEAHINTTQTGIRGLVSLPFASGKKLRILAFGKNAADSGADIVGTDETIDEINEQSSRASRTKGKINFDLVVTSPDWMSKLAKVARILGPRSLMPNPKNGTITDDLKKAVEGFQAGKTEYKTESKGFVIHMGLGKLDQPTEQLSANIKVLLQTLGKTRVKKVTLSPSMGPAVKIDLSSL